jgi:protein phosphatase
MPTHPFHFAMLTHRGRVRKGNEDFCAAAIESGAFLVCDGMGGAAAGEVASRLAGETFLKVVAVASESKDSRSKSAPRAPRQRVADAVEAANRAVFEHARQSPELRGMGTTLVALLFEPPGLTLVHVGDSRCYRFRHGVFEVLTQDHSLVEEQVRSGELTPSQAAQHPWRNIITRAVGSQAQVEPDIQELDPQPGDLYLLASDGLTRELSDAAIASLLAEAYHSLHVGTGFAGTSTGKKAGVAAIEDTLPDLAILARTLVEKANAAGGGDNITVLLLGIR